MAYLDFSGLTYFLNKIKTIFVASSQKGAANGIASLDSSGKVPSSQLPSYVDDVIEVASYSNLPQTGESGKIYVVLDTNKTYRWSGSAYVEISNPNIMTGATGSAAGTSGLVPVPAAGDNVKYLKGNGTWSTVDALPSVSSSDNGKYLRVVNGDWAAATVPNAEGADF